MPVQEIEQSTPPTCPHCDHPPFKNSWALKSHIRFKHSGEEGLEAQPVVVAQPESKLTSEKDQLLAEIERLKLQALGRTLPQPKTYTQEEYDAKQPEKLVPPPRRKAWDNRPPWVVPGAQPGRIIPVNQLNADKKTQDSVMKTLMGAKKIPEKYIEYADTPPTKVEFKRGSWADVYKEDLLVRMIPFIWQQDKETKQNWAIMLEQDFYGKPRSFWQFSYPLLIIGFDKSRNYVDYYGKGFKIAVDEVSQLQIPLHEMDDDIKLQARLEDNSFKSQEMALYRELIIHAKKKWNWTLIIILVLVAVILGVVVWYFHSNPNALTGLTNILQPKS